MVTLSDKEIADYTRSGFIVVPSLFSTDELAAFDERFDALVTGEMPPPPGMKLMRDVMVVKGAVEPRSPQHAINKLTCLENDEVLFAYARSEKLAGIARQLVGGELYSLASNVFNKPPGVDGKHPMHQDLRYFKLQPAEKIVGTWTAISPATRENGCLAIIPGTHDRGLLEHGDPDWEYVNHGFFGIEDIDVDKRVHIELAPGDTLFFHPLLVHGSGHNRTSGFRRAISVHYAAGDCVGGSSWRDGEFTRHIG